MNWLGLLQGLHHHLPELRQKAEQELKSYLSIQDPYHQSRDLRALLSKVERSDNATARRLVREYHSKIGQILHYEEEWLQLLDQHHVEKKEFYEAKQFYFAIKDFFPTAKEVNDCCAGNGLVGMIWGIEHPDSEVRAIDIQRNKNHDTLIESISGLTSTKGLTALNVRYLIQDIRSEPIPRGDLNLSIHACNDLTDIIIQQSIAQRVPFAVMPCCHSKCEYIPEGILGYFDRTEAIDLMRIRYALDHGYDVNVRSIDPRITPKSRIIIGKPVK